MNLTQRKTGRNNSGMTDSQDFRQSKLIIIMKVNSDLRRENES